MSEPATSGENAPVAPAETVSATPAQPAASEQAAPATQAPVFGSSRGSGLARGKRANNNATASGNTATAGTYRPTAIQIVTTAREYKNPFASAEEQPAAPEATQAPAPAAAPVQETPAPAAPIAQAPEPAPAQTVEPAAAEKPAAPADEPRAELNILPPEDKPRRAQSWQSDSFVPEQKERATFQPRTQGEQRDRRGRNQRREGGNPPAENASVTRQHTPAPAPEKKKSTGLLGWIKGLFGGSDEPQGDGKNTAVDGDRNERHHREGGRRHRGGRNRGYRGEQRGEYRGNENRDAGSTGEYHPRGGNERRFDRGDRGDRGRQRGGRNRHRDGNRGSGNGGGENPSQ